MSANVQYYGLSEVSIELWNNRNEEKAQIRAASKKNGVIFYTSHIMNCSKDDAINAQLVAESALEYWHDSMLVGLGSYVNQQLANSGFIGRDWSIE